MLRLFAVTFSVTEKKKHYIRRTMQASLANLESSILSIVPKDGKIFLLHLLLMLRNILAPVDFVLEKAGAQKLISLGDTDDNEFLVRLAQVIGDCARAEENRGTLGEAGALELLGKLLETKNNDLRIAKFAARAVGNLCYEHRKCVPASILENRSTQLRGAISQLITEPKQASLE
jgi:hypothetical protein